MFRWIKDLAHILWRHKVSDMPDLMRHRFVHKSALIEPSIRLLSVNPHWGIEKLSVPKFWNSTKGAGIKVAVLDTGVDVQHIDLRDAIAEAVDMTPERDPRDYNGHGTHVAGIIAARNKLGSGMTGIAPESKIYSVKVLNSQGSGNYDWIVAGLRWAVERKVDIINMSLGCKAPYTKMHEIVEAAYKAGIVIVAAAGNDGHMREGDNMGYPARYDEVIAVGSVDRSMSASQFSSIGKELDIMAPGGMVFSTFPKNRYATLSGTSQAAPFISGICALILAKHRATPNSATPIRNATDMLEHLKKASIDVEKPGWDERSGYGVINPDQIFTDV